MKLTRLRVEQFKQFRQPFEIADLDPGINLITGANEAGKSTLVAAIRAAFLERHRSSSVDDLRPWDDASASPSVELDFLLGAEDCQLSKRFLGRKRCQLRIGNRQLDGAEAEDHLAELLGYQHAGKGASKTEHWGIPGLLWIQQGAAQELREPLAHASDHLRTALNAALGEVAGGEGDDVLARVQALRNELLTAATGKPRGPWQQAIEASERLERELRQLDAEIATYRQQVDRLAVLRREQAADDSEQPWIAFRRQERQAAERLENVRTLETELQNGRQRAQQMETQIQLLRAQLESYARQEEAVSQRHAALMAAEQQRTVAHARVGQWQGQVQAAVERHAQAREVLRQARQAATRRDLARQLDTLRQQRDAIAELLRRATTEQQRHLELRRHLAATEITAADLQALRGQQEQLRELDIRREAAATRLSYALESGVQLDLGGVSLSGQGECHLTEATRLRLPGLGQLVITPGGADLAELGRQRQAIADRQTALLQRLGLASLEAAEARQRQHQASQAAAASAAAALKALAPQGMDTLKAELADIEARLQAAVQALAGLPEAADGGELPSLAQAESAEEAARLSLEQSNHSLSEARIAAGNADTAQAAAARELAAAQAIVAAPDRSARLAALRSGLIDAQAELASLASRIASLERHIAEAQPELLRQDVDRFRQSAAQLERQHAERRDNLLRLEVELQTSGARGLEERRAETARDLEQASRRRDELQRRALALDHLHQLLRDKRTALTRRLQAPLQRHLNRYLQLLFPGAQLEIDEHLRPGPLSRHGAQGLECGDFDSLSFGAREQMGIISRLAYADLLQEAGRPTLIILDDALVHSDENRLAQMKRLLFDAGRRHQILLFTCHPANWRDLGVPARSLEGLRSGR